ncbi:MAG: PAS domain-containing protein [Chthoniobacter sp.]|nr:PAS domain-containing protein [Chthoniobacter sp.]
MKSYEGMTKAALIQRLQELEQRQPVAGIAFDHGRLQHDLQVQQVELETQNQQLREAQRLIEDSRDRYAELYDFSPVGHVALDTAGIIREINLTACAMLGAERARLENLPFLTHVAAADRAKLRDHLRPRERPGARVESELRLVAKGHPTIVVVMQSVLVGDKDDGGVLCRATLTDISRHQAAEDALIESEQRFRHLVETTRMIAWERPIAEQSFTYVSAWAVEALGYPLADWMKEGFFHQHIVHPDDRQLVAERNEKAVRKKESDYELEYRLLTADGRTLVFRDIIHVVKGPKGPEVVKGFLIDITRRKHAETRLRELTEQYELAVAGTADGLWDWDLTTGAVFYAPRFRELLGFAPGDRAFSPTIAAFRERLHPDDLASTEEAIRRAVEDAEPYRATYRLKTKTGDWRWFEARGATARDGSSRATRMAGSITDITERRQSEDALRESEMRQRLAMEGADLGLWDWDVPSGRFIVNERWCAMLGYALEEIAPKIQSWRDLVHPDDHAAVTAAWESHRDRLVPGYEVEHRLRHKNGSWVWVLDKGRVIARDTADQPLRVCGTHLDITERKKAEEELGESNLRQRLALEGADLGIWDWDVPTDVVTLNDRWCSMLGYRIDEIEPHSQGWKDLVHPDDWPAVMQAWTDHTEGRASRYEVEYRLSHKQGGWVWVLDKGRIIARDPANQPLRVCGTHLDITKRKEAEQSLRASEEKFRRMTETIDQVFWMTSADKLEILYVSPAYERIWGRTCQSLYEQPLTWLDALHPEDRPRFTALPKTQASGAYDVEYRILRPDGVERWIHDRAFPIRDAKGKVSRIVGVAEDITERRRLEGELLEISDYEQQRIGQDLHDDLCQQLVGLGFQLEALLPELDSTSAPYRGIEEICTLLRRATTHARSLAHGLSPVPVEPDGLMNALHSLAAHASIVHRISCDYACTQPVTVADHTMAGHLYRIAQEAISNATRHGQASRVRITLAVTAPDAARLSIADNGKGCALPIKMDGGMGLRIMRYRASMIRGTLHVTASPDGGLCVTCNFHTHTKP